ncbi:MAG TPA: hypothetical protein VK081_07340 [Planctomycetota bacterium]|nr:hypothetical protein [Planctomycetota bacterium]
MFVRTLPFLALSAAAAAQWSVVAPAHYEHWEGTTLSSGPFSGTSFPIRLQQVHVEPKGQVRTITRIAFRSSAVTPDARFASRNVDMDLWMGHGSLATVGTDFAGNYLSPPQHVVARRMVQTPDWSGGSASSPTPFDFVIPLDTPFTHNGVDDFVWEVNVFGASGTGTAVPLDAAMSGMNLVIPSNYQLHGTGCQVGGNAMTLRPTGSLQGFPVNAWILDWTATACPPNSPAVLLLGVVNPDISVPGLCTNLYVLPDVQVGGTTDASGGFAPFPSTSPLPRIAYQPAGVGVRLEAQVAVLDTSGPQLYASNGASSILPPWTPTVGIARLAQTPASGPTLSTTLGIIVQVGG